MEKQPKKPIIQRVLEPIFFLALLFIYFLGSIVLWVVNIKVLPLSFKKNASQKVEVFFDNIYKTLDPKHEDSISKRDLIELAVRNM